eukprot:16435145-Heterocapsa_arctica.AAC.1
MQNHEFKCILLLLTASFPGGASSGARPRGRSPGCGSCAARPGARWRPPSRSTSPTTTSSSSP